MLGDSAPEGFKVRPQNLRNRPFDVGPANWIPYSNVLVAWQQPEREINDFDIWLLLLGFMEGFKSRVFDP